MVTLILSHVDPDTRRRIDQLPRFIQLMGDEAATHITRFQRPRTPGEPSSRDYDFSYDAITHHQAEGYNLVKRTLEDARRLRLPLPDLPSLSISTA
jgi:NTE family protein